MTPRILNGLVVDLGPDDLEREVEKLIRPEVRQVFIELVQVERLEMGDGSGSVITVEFEGHGLSGDWS